MKIERDVCVCVYWVMEETVRGERNRWMESEEEEEEGRGGGVREEREVGRGKTREENTHACFTTGW